MLLLLSLSIACVTKDGGGGDKPADTGGGPADSNPNVEDTGPSCVEPPAPPDTKDTGDGPHAASVLTGTIVWTLTFDADAHALGFTDCTYTRVYDANVEIGDQGYLCPECSLITAGTAVMTVGHDDCYVQIDDSAAERTESLGIGTVGGVEDLFRGGGENVALKDMGPLVGEGPYTVSWSDDLDLTDGGTMTLAATGDIALSTDPDTLVEDVTGARTTPYTCGWPMNNPGGANASWTVADGEVFPNVRLDDQCDEAVDLWDFRGYYLVIDSSATNCGPCQQMASTAEAFKADMEDACVPVEVVTLLNDSLSTVNLPAPLDVRQEWADTYGLTSPVLGDLGAGYALLPDYLGLTDGMSYPGIVVLDPDGRVMAGHTGFGADSTWPDIEALIQSDWDARP